MQPLKDLAGSLEVLGTVGSGTLALPIAAAMGLAKGARKIGTREGTDEAQTAAGEAHRQMTYEPRTASGRSQLEALAKLLESSKIPPFVPGVGKLSRPGPGATRYASEAAGEALLPRIDSFMEGTGLKLNAVKEPGGHFTPHTGDWLRSQLMRYGGDVAPSDALNQWADRMIPRYLSRQMGTSKDPSNKVKLPGGADELTYEQAMDRLLRAKPHDPNEQAGMIAPMAREGEQVWHLRGAGPEGNRAAEFMRLQGFLQHAGDFARTIPEGDLARMDVPALLAATVKADARGLKTKAKSADARLEAAQRITAEHPPGDVLHETDAGKWLRYGRGQDPELVKRGLSVDTCLGDHCVAGVAHGKPEWGYPGWVPARDIVTGQPVRSDLRDATSYIANALAGKGDILSLRTPEGFPAATMELRAPLDKSVSRSYVRDLLGKPEYLSWQRARREAGVPIEQHAPELHGTVARANEVLQIPDFMGGNNDVMRRAAGITVGGGKVSPLRGPLNAEHIRTISEMYPQHAERLAFLLENPPQEIAQLKGFKNGPMHPAFQTMTRDMLNRQGAEQYLATRGRGMGTGDMENSGLFLGSGDNAGNVRSAVERLAEIRGNRVLTHDYEVRKYMHLIEELLKQKDPRVNPTQARDVGQANRFIGGVDIPRE